MAHLMLLPLAYNNRFMIFHLKGYNYINFPGLQHRRNEQQHVSIPAALEGVWTGLPEKGN